MHRLVSRCGCASVPSDNPSCLAFAMHAHCCGWLNDELHVRASFIAYMDIMSLVSLWRRWQC